MSKSSRAYILVAACLMVILCLVGGWWVRAWQIKRRNLQEETACLSNLIGLKMMILNWKDENDLADGTRIATNAFVARFFPSDGLLRCPSNGKYDLDVVGGTVTCSVHTNLVECGR